MATQRPDPDQLLRVQTDEARRSSGRLKIFFGYAAGVGKTYAMLEAAAATRPTASISSWATSSRKAGRRPKRCSRAWTPFRRVTLPIGA